MATTTTRIAYTEGAAPATPPAGQVYEYAKADGLLYSKDDADVETLVSGGVGGSNPTWQDWTPTLTQSSSLTLTTTVAKYIQVGGVTHFRLFITPTSNGTANNPIVIGGQPAALQDADAGSATPIFRIIGYGQFQDSGTAFHGVWVVAFAAQDWRLIRMDATAYYGQSPNIAVNGSGDVIHVQGTVRTA